MNAEDDPRDADTTEMFAKLLEEEALEGIDEGEREDWIKTTQRMDAIKAVARRLPWISHRLINRYATLYRAALYWRLYQLSLPPPLKQPDQRRQWPRELP